MSDITNHLSQLIKKKASARDQELKKRAGISQDLDNADDGTQPAATGERAAENKAEAGKSTAASADGGARPSTPNASVTKNTEGSSAGSASQGATGAMLEPVKEADNGKEKPENKVAGAAGLLQEAQAVAAELRKVAAELASPTPATEDKAEEAPAEKNAGDKGEAKPELDKLGQYLVTIARNSGNEQLNKVAAGMDDAALADAATEEMLAGLESGEIDETTAGEILQDASEYGAIGEEDLAGADDAAVEEIAAAAAAGELSPEEAEALLAELLEAGLITEEDLAAAQAELGVGMEAPIDQPTPEDMQAAEQLAGPEVAEAIADPGLEGEPSMDPKLAYLLEVGPGHPEYMRKLAMLYPDIMKAGADDFDKLAEDLVKEGEPNEPPAVEDANKNEAQPATNAGADADGAEGGPASVTALSDDVEVETPESDIEKEAMAEVAKELDLSVEEASELMSVKVASFESDKDRLKHKYRSALLSKAASIKAQKG